MAMDIANGERSILNWDEDHVHRWLTSLGFSQYEAQIKEHNISGDVLCLLDAEDLKAIGISTVGQRLAILKAVYQAKLAHHVPVEADHYIPPSFPTTAQKVHSLEEDNKRLNERFQLLVDEINHAPLKRQPSFKWAQYVNPTKSPTKPDVESPHPSPQQTDPDISHSRGLQHNQSHKHPPAPVESPIQPSPSTSSRPSRQESTDNLKSFKVSLEDPTWKVLPAALKKYKINNDNWQNYAMFICYGSPGNRIERCLSYDEKPLLLFQKLKDAKKNPVFMLKHIKDIRSPIAVAQQKHALRKASVASESSSSQSNNKSSASGQGRAGARPPKLEVNDISPPAPPLTGTTPQAGWPEVMSPILEKQEHDAVNIRDTCSSSTTLVGHTSTAEDTARREMPPPMSGVSYAVAIYPYMAEQEDEFDVVVGDTFVILSRARGWWVVQRDPTGSGVVDTDTSKQGWVPAGCLLETNVPVASAIAEATAASKASGSCDLPLAADSKTPILPLSIISTKELDLVKDDALRVFKKYNHWSYAVKEDGGDRGWVPSWFIGKVPTPGAVPPTPSTGSAPALSGGPSVSLDTESANQNQVSPMSSAFPPPNRSGVI
ncbi:uncharacterized protein EDB91DRAFT_1236126 [Suillus paluster]|uniref:uncharacterized protein n=1 Tax=Suillus paluster TaxID=48578 RepID=UPI001B85FB08|nr:uncharacterized protein EDB91DRAFT_1236126 [Suillus paluster]KAG1746713.1 hypothetical protein EDB91DRAFT_1236126 [Suillus paluster]